MRQKVQILCPEGWEFCGLMDATHTVDMFGTVEEFKPNWAKFTVLEVARALVQLDEKGIRRKALHNDTREEG